MDLIYSNTTKKDIGVVKDYKCEMAYGADENDFELTVSSDSNICDKGYIVYVDGTEYGGIVDRVNINTASRQLKYIGRTWHGILDSKVIEPPSGSAYRTVSGDANAVIGQIITLIGLNSLFEAPTAVSGVNLSSFKFERYTTAYLGLRQMLASVNAKLKMSYNGSKVTLWAEPRGRYEDITSDLMDFDIEKNFVPVNHLICLGKGELQERTVLHLYTKANGDIVNTQYLTGADERAEVLDYPNAESEDELRAEGIKRLQEAWNTDSVDVQFNNKDVYDVDDVVVATEQLTGIVVEKAITKRIVTFTDTAFNIRCEIGDING